MSPASSPISSAISSSGTRVADHRLVDVEVEEADLGVGDPADRLDVDAHQLQEGDEREAGGEDAGAVAHRARRPRGLSSRSRPSGVPRMTRIRSISSGSSPVSLGDLLDRDLLLARGEELLGEAEGETALAPRPLQLLERVAALAHPRDDPRLSGRGRGPAAAPDRDDLLRRPPFQGARPRRPTAARPRSRLIRSSAMVSRGYRAREAEDRAGRPRPPRSVDGLLTIR